MKEVYNIKFWRPQDFAKLINGLSKTKVLKDKELQEIYYCFPLMVREIISRREPYMIGKVVDEHNPFDIALVKNSEYLKISDATAVGKKNLRGAVLIQLKRIMDYRQVERIPVVEWGGIVQTKINEVGESVQQIPNGLLYLHNRLHFKKTTQVQLEAALENLKFKKNYPYSQAALGIEEGEGEKDGRIHYWQLYPRFSPIGSVTPESIEELKKIYS